MLGPPSAAAVRGRSGRARSPVSRLVGRARGGSGDTGGCADKENEYIEKYKRANQDLTQRVVDYRALNTQLSERNRQLTRQVRAQTEVASHMETEELKELRERLAAVEDLRRKDQSLIGALRQRLVTQRCQQPRRCSPEPQPSPPPSQPLRGGSGCTADGGGGGGGGCLSCCCEAAGGGDGGRFPEEAVVLEGLVAATKLPLGGSGVSCAGSGDGGDGEDSGVDCVRSGGLPSLRLGPSTPLPPARPPSVAPAPGEEGAPSAGGAGAGSGTGAGGPSSSPPEWALVHLKESHLTPGRRHCYVRIVQEHVAALAQELEDRRRLEEGGGSGGGAPSSVHGRPVDCGGGTGARIGTPRPDGCSSARCGLPPRLCHGGTGAVAGGGATSVSTSGNVGRHAGVTPRGRPSSGGGAGPALLSSRSSLLSAYHLDESCSSACDSLEAPLLRRLDQVNQSVLDMLALGKGVAGGSMEEEEKVGNGFLQEISPVTRLAEGLEVESPPSLCSGQTSNMSPGRLLLSGGGGTAVSSATQTDLGQTVVEDLCVANLNGIAQFLRTVGHEMLPREEVEHLQRELQQREQRLASKDREIAVLQRRLGESEGHLCEALRQIRKLEDGAQGLGGDGQSGEEGDARRLLKGGLARDGGALTAAAEEAAATAAPTDGGRRDLLPMAAAVISGAGAAATRSMRALLLQEYSYTNLHPGGLAYSSRMAPCQSARAPLRPVPAPAPLAPATPPRRARSLGPSPAAGAIRSAVAPARRCQPYPHSAPVSRSPSPLSANIRRECHTNATTAHAVAATPFPRPCSSPVEAAGAASAVGVISTSRSPSPAVATTLQPLREGAVPARSTDRTDMLVKIRDLPPRRSARDGSIVLREHWRLLRGCGAPLCSPREA